MSQGLVNIEAIAALVPAGARVLDLGCGDGALLAYLQQHRGCSGYGVELDDANVLACMRRGVDVLQLNLDQGLQEFADQSFDVVLQIDTFQHLHNAQTMLLETVRVGRMGIIAFPNFAHWSNRLSILRGRMPVNARLPYEWYNTPNIRRHLCRLWRTGRPQRPARTRQIRPERNRPNRAPIAQPAGQHGGVPRGAVSE